MAAGLGGLPLGKVREFTISWKQHDNNPYAEGSAFTQSIQDFYKPLYIHNFARNTPHFHMIIRDFQFNKEFGCSQFHHAIYFLVSSLQPRMYNGARLYPEKSLNQLCAPILPPRLLAGQKIFQKKHQPNQEENRNVFLYMYVCVVVKLV